MYGKRSVYVLDANYDAYVDANWPTTLAEPAPPRRGTWVARPLDASMVATRAQTVAVRDAVTGTARLWDVRSLDEYEGSTTLPGAARPGRIPWTTRRVDWWLFRQDDGSWRNVSETRALAAETFGGATPDDTGPAHIFYCQSAVRTTQLIFGLARAGWPLERLKNYDGSWVEWSHLAAAEEIAIGE